MVSMVGVAVGGCSGVHGGCSSRGSVVVSMVGVVVSMVGVVVSVVKLSLFIPLLAPAGCQRQTGVREITL